MAISASGSGKPNSMAMNRWRVEVTGIVGDDQHEFGRSFEELAGTFQRQQAAVVGQGVKHHGDVLPRFHHFVQIADGALSDGTGQGAIDPDGVAALQQVAAGQVGRRQVVVA
jgi:hypothetical protein